MTVKGVDGDGSAHKRLMMLIKKIRIVLIDEYRTTKACPIWCKRENKMKQTLGNSTFTDRNDIVCTKRVHGLSHCKIYKKLWSRDYVASLNIVSYFKNGKACLYLFRIQIIIDCIP